MELLQPKGVRDFPPEEKILRDALLAVLREQFERYGFSPLETPLLERYEVLSAKYAGGAEILKETFRLVDQGERELGLRYDLTVPLARFIAMNPDVKLPFKRYAIGTVYRDGPIKLGRYREFYQCDCDIVGANTAAADAQCVQLGFAVFAALGIPMRMELNSVPLLKLMLTQDGCAPDSVIDAMLELDKLKKVGQEGVVAALETKGIPGACVQRVIAIAQLQTNAEKLSAIAEAYGSVPELERLTQVLSLGQPLTSGVDGGVAGGAMVGVAGTAQESFALVPTLVFDPSLSRGLSYYTGVVYELFMIGSQITSSAGSGGRYDKMIGEFVGRSGSAEYPAVGISFGLEPITEHLKIISPSTRKTVTRVYVIPIRTPLESNVLVSELRAAGVKADVDIVERGISKNLDYANALGIPFVVFVGKNELAIGQYKLKDMTSGEEAMLDKAALFARLRDA